MKIIIIGKLPGLNDYTGSTRAHRQIGAKIKHSVERDIILQLKASKIAKVYGRHKYIFHWYEKNKRRDPDNIAFAKKFIFDALVKAGILDNDGWKQVSELGDKFYIDTEEQRVEVEIE